MYIDLWRIHGLAVAFLWMIGFLREDGHESFHGAEAIGGSAYNELVDAPQYENEG